MGAGRANLRWDPNTEGDLSGYRAYRAMATAGPFLLAADPGLTADPTAPAVSLTDFGADGTWYFMVTAYNNANNEGAAAGPVSKAIDRPEVRIGRTYK